MKKSTRFLKVTLHKNYRLSRGWKDPAGPAASALEQGLAEKETIEETAATRGRKRCQSVTMAKEKFTSVAESNFLH